MSEEEPTKGAPFQSVSTRVMMGSQNKHENKNKKPDKQTDKKQMQSSGWKNGGSEDFFTRRHFTEGQVKKEVQASMFIWALQSIRKRGKQMEDKGAHDLSAQRMIKIR